MRALKEDPMMLWVLALLLTIVYALWAISVASAEEPKKAAASCPDQLNMASLQAKEYYDDRDAKQRQKIILQAQLNYAEARIRLLEKELKDLRKALPEEKKD